MNKRLSKAQSDHQKWLESRGLTRKQIAVKRRLDPSLERIAPVFIAKNLPKTSDMIALPHTGYKTGMLDKIHLEDEVIQREIRRKAKAVAPAWSKGSYQYVTPGADPSDLGRKK